LPGSTKSIGCGCNYVAIRRVFLRVCRSGVCRQSWLIWKYLMVVRGWLSFNLWNSLVCTWDWTILMRVGGSRC
jgi:hypothetical protein